MKSYIFRLPNVIGDHATHGVIYDLINKVKENPSEIEVLGNGTQEKPYMHVKDVVDLMYFIWRKVNDPVNIYNIAGTGTTSVKTIAEMVIEEMGTDTKIRYTGGDRGWKSDSPKYYPDNSKMMLLKPPLFTEGRFPISDEAVRQTIKEVKNELL